MCVARCAQHRIPGVTTNVLAVSSPDPRGASVQNHNVATPLTGLAKHNLVLDRSSTAFWAFAPARTVMVFLHGYGGGALTTWGEFADLAAIHPRFTGVDLVFLGYPSRSSRAAYNVSLIYQTLQLLMERPRDFFDATFGPDRPADFAYDSVILVGHSLGGAIARGVAQTAARLNKNWAHNLRLALFAPAHTGADLLKLIRLAGGVSNWSKPVFALAFARQQALIDLEPGSQFLTALLSDAVQLGDHPAAIASLVVHAESDPVVSPNPFNRDPPLTPYAGRNHVDCCKPRRVLFELPVNDVASVRTVP